MPGPPPKPESIRQRRNKKSSAATLTTPERARIPTIPNPAPRKRKWHALTRTWWKNIWRSPMSTRYLTTDLDGLAMLAILVDDFYKQPDAKLLGEIRLQAGRFGLSPWDRAKLEWRVTEEPAEKKPRPAASRRNETSDPRKILKAVK